MAESRQPRGLVKLNGEIITGWVLFEVDNNAYRSADTFRVVFAASRLPDKRDASWLSKQNTVYIEIFAGLPKDAESYTEKDLALIISGNADEISFNPIETSIEITGRDKTALLIDTKTSEHFLNQTASEIAKAIASRHGLKAEVTETKSKSGSYYQIDHSATQQEQSEWELLTYLANQENFDLYVIGDTLHFEKKQNKSSGKYIIEWIKPKNDIGYHSANVVNLSFSKNLTVAKGVSVEVHSWNAKKKKGFSAFYPISKKTITPGSTGSKTQNYRYTIPGLTQDQAEKRAESLYRQIIQHTMNMDADMPADNVLNCQKVITVKGTDTSFDQDYYPSSVTRSMSITGGYKMSIKAKNTSPELENAD